METAQTKTLSPGDLAEIIGVSESSIRRWVDGGRIDVMRTAGGHRRIPVRSALAFVRDNELQILRPDLLGMPDLQVRALHEELTADALFEMLEAGDAAAVRGALAGSFVSGTPLDEIYDGPVAGALDRLGTLWHHGEEGIYVEHMATSICIEAINEIRLLMPPPDEYAPVAVGGAVEDDPYIVPNLMAASLFADAGFREINLGPDTPAVAFLKAVDVHHPEAVWLAVTGHFDEEHLRKIIRELVDPLAHRNVEAVVGGRTASMHADLWPSSVTVLGSMAELAAFANDCRRGA